MNKQQYAVILEAKATVLMSMNAALEAQIVAMEAKGMAIKTLVAQGSRIEEMEGLTDQEREKAIASLEALFDRLDKTLAGKARG